MLGTFGNELTLVLKASWPILFTSIVLIATVRIAYLIKNKQEFIFYKELTYLAFMIYILCLFQVVTFRDLNALVGNNFVPFKEICRYTFGSRLFIKNILGNVIMFIPYGFFVAFYSKIDKYRYAFIIIGLASISIECMQLVIGRIFDVDDIMLNIIGGMLGFTLYILLDKLGSICPKVLQSKIFLNILSVILVFIVLLFIIWR